ncbi:MAG: C40 family peptidase [Ignavibacteria bacterium]
MRDANRLIYLLFIILSFLVFLRCSTTSNTSRYGDNDDYENSENARHRFSSYEDERSITADENDNITDYNSDEYEDFDYENSVDVSEIVERYNLSEFDYNNDTITLKEKLLLEIIKYLDTPYEYGGTSTNGIDCSAFTQNVFKNTLSTDLLRSARDQYSQGEIISHKEDLQFGDLVFFDTQRGVRPGHVGIYIGDELFAHASTTNGVTISSINHSYYQSRYVGGRRIEPEGTF